MPRRLRYCAPCDRWMWVTVCRACGAETDPPDPVPVNTRTDSDVEDDRRAMREEASE